MTGPARAILPLLLAAGLAGCAAAPSVVGREDPAPLLAALSVKARHPAPPVFNLALDLSWRGTGGRGSREGFLFADRPGHAAFEIPGPLGSTLLAAEATDGAVRVSLPEEGRSWSGRAGEAIPGLPFPLPASFGLMWELLAGTIPLGLGGEAAGFLLADGTRALDASANGLRVRALFRGPALLRLSYLHPSGETLTARFGEGGREAVALEWDGAGERVTAKVLPEPAGIPAEPSP